MKQGFNIFKFEYGAYLKSKAFVIITILLMLVVGVGLSIPRIISLFDNNKTESNDGGFDVDLSEDRLVGLPKIALLDTFSDPEISHRLVQERMINKNIEIVSNVTEEQLKERVIEGEYESAIILEDPKSYKYIVNNLSMYDSTMSTINGVMVDKYRADSLQEKGLTDNEISDLLHVEIKNEVVQSGKDQMASFIYTYVMVFALYMVIMLYGQLVASSVASEKSSRAMELLITSAKPSSLMFGKVLGVGFAGLSQMLLVMLTGVASYIFNKEYIDASGILSKALDIPVSTLVYMIIFFILGYFIYAFMYASLASLASRVEDMSTLVMPVTFIFVIMFMITMMSMSSGKVDTLLMKVCSFVPIFSPMAMFVRITMGNVTFIEILISIIILLGSTIGIGYIAAGIYRMGVLLYGKTPKPTEVFKLLKNSK